MPWIKHAVVDLIVTACILAATLGGQTWAAWAIWIYTPFYLLIRVGAVKSRVAQKKDPVPVGVYHVLFAINTFVPLFHAWKGGSTNWYWVAAGWAVIWVLSVYTTSRRPAGK